MKNKDTISEIALMISLLTIFACGVVMGGFLVWLFNFSW